MEEALSLTIMTEDDKKVLSIFFKFGMNNKIAIMSKLSKVMSKFYTDEITSFQTNDFIPIICEELCAEFDDMGVTLDDEFFLKDDQTVDENDKMVVKTYIKDHNLTLLNDTWAGVILLSDLSINNCESKSNNVKVYSALTVKNMMEEVSDEKRWTINKKNMIPFPVEFLTPINELNINKILKKVKKVKKTYFGDVFTGKVYKF